MEERDYAVEIDPSENRSSHGKALSFIGRDRRVVDFGCWNGFVDRHLLKRGCTVTGFELDPDMAARAEQYCEKVITGDLDALDITAELEGEYDVGYFGDVLEHLRDPRRVLVAMREKLAPGGFIVVSVPNVAHASVRLALLRGQFDYSDKGILDATHLKFYTRESICDLLESAGYIVQTVDWVEQKLPAGEIEKALDPLGLANMEEVIKAFSEWEAVAFQYVIKAVPATEDAQVERLAGEKMQAEYRLRTVEQDLAVYKQLAAASDDLTEQVSALKAEQEKSGEYQRSLEQTISAKDAYIRELEEAIGESRQAVEECKQKIAEMAGMLSEIESVGETARGRRKRRNAK